MDISSSHAQIAKILEMAKEAHWLENKHLATDDIQRKWAEKSAPLAAVLGVACPSRPVDLDSSAVKPALLQNAHAITPTPVSTTSTKRRSTNEPLSHKSNAPLMMMTQSQTSQPMLKKRSGQSTHGAFINTGTAVEPLALDSWQTSNEGPFSAFTIPTSPRPAKARKTANGCLPIQIPEYSADIKEYDPAEFIQKSRATLSPAFSPSAVSRRNSSQQRSPVTPLSQSPATCSDGFTNATTLSSADMQRHDSLGSSSCYGAFNMMRLDSRRSNVMRRSDNKVDDSPTLDNSLSFLSTPVSDVPAIDFSFSVSHAGGMVDATNQVPEVFLTGNSDLSLGLEDDMSMMRSVSSESSSSSKSRVSRRTEEQAVLSTRPLAPKDNAESMSRQTSTSSSLGADMTRQLSADGSKVAIQKAKYTRPPHEKVYCSLCNIKPEGFRGPHELRRHAENKHGVTRKMWICKDTSPDQMFLSKCKSCRERKTYGAYYNAGAHLRRIHFNPREKGKKGDKSAKARGGDGGGDHPPMDILKLWMEEIDVPVTMNMPSSDDSEDDDEEAYLNPDDSQENYDTRTYITTEFLPNFPMPSVNAARLRVPEAQHQEHALPPHNGTPVQMNDFPAKHTQSFGSATHQENFSNLGFPPMFNTNAGEIYDPYATQCFSSSTPTAPQFNTNAMSLPSVNQPLATNNLSADCSLISSMNSPADYLELSEYDLFDIS